MTRGGLLRLLARAVLGVLASTAPGRSADLPGEPITPVPAVAGLAPAKVRLGERLFHDSRLSHGDAVSCASCHRLDQGGDDGQARSPGLDGRPLPFNTPTVFNAALSFRLNWRGNHRVLEEQAEAVLQDRRLMNTSWDELLAKLRADPGYREAFAAAYRAEPDRAAVLDALASFERSLLTPDAPFDRYLRGERDAITDEAAHGYALFKSYGCAACHQGVNVGGNLFQKFGVFENPFRYRRELTEADQGRFALTGEERDRHVFRVPSLRNVGVTGPYFHDGSAATLEQAVEAMARSQLGRTLSEREIGLIVAFLRSLTGLYHGGRVAPVGGRAHCATRPGDCS
jgi:cytochrome c peroxidase